jgi:hypothetical protein
MGAVASEFLSFSKCQASSLVVRRDYDMPRKRLIVLFQGIALLALWICGLPVLQSTVLAQTTPQVPVEKPAKTKKAKKAVDDATSPAAPAASTPAAAVGETAAGQVKRAAPAPTKNASTADIQSAKADGKVWVNTESGVYHKSGKWFGATKQGKFMTEQDAIKAGYRAAKNEK